MVEVVGGVFSLGRGAAGMPTPGDRVVGAKYTGFGFEPDPVGSPAWSPARCCISRTGSWYVDDSTSLDPDLVRSREQREGRKEKEECRM